MKKNDFKGKISKMATPLTALLVSALAASAGAAGTFDATALAPVQVATDGILAVGVGVTIAFVVYKVGKRASNKV